MAILNFFKDNQALVQFITALIALLAAIVSRKKVVRHQRTPPDPTPPNHPRSASTIQEPKPTSRALEEANEALRNIRAAFLVVIFANGLLLLASLFAITTQHYSAGLELLITCGILVTPFPSIVILHQAFKYLRYISTAAAFKLASWIILGAVIGFLLPFITAIYALDGLT